MVTHRRASSPAHQWRGITVRRRRIAGSGMAGEKVWHLEVKSIPYGKRGNFSTLWSATVLYSAFLTWAASILISYTT